MESTSVSSESSAPAPAPAPASTLSLSSSLSVSLLSRLLRPRRPLACLPLPPAPFRAPPRFALAPRLAPAFLAPFLVAAADVVPFAAPRRGRREATEPPEALAPPEEAATLVRCRFAALGLPDGCPSPDPAEPLAPGGGTTQSSPTLTSTRCLRFRLLKRRYMATPRSWTRATHPGVDYAPVAATGAWRGKRYTKHGV